MKTIIFVIALFISGQTYAGEFLVSGLKIGDRVNDPNDYGFCPPANNGIQECLTIYKIAGSDALITYYFDGLILKNATIAFDSRCFSKMVSIYSKQLQQEPITHKEPIDFDGEILTNKISIWKLNNGELVVKKYKSYKKGFVYLNQDKT